MKRLKLKNISIRKGILLTGMALLLPCLLFTAVNILFSTWPLYNRNHPLLIGLYALALLLFFLLMKGSKKFLPLYCRHEKTVFIGFILLFLICQIVLGIQLIHDPMTDAEQVYTAAKNLSASGHFENSERSFIYFTRYPHNLGSVYLLALIFRLFPFVNPYILCILLSSLLFSAGYACTGRCAGMLSGKLAELRFLLFSLTCLPFFYCSAELYTDVLALPFSSIILYFFLKADTVTGKKKWLFFLLFYLFSFIGSFLRVTTVIISIACLIALLFRHPKQFLPAVLLFLMLFIPGRFLNQKLNNHYLGKENIDKNAFPVYHYIAMGLPVQEDEGYGQYGYGGWLLFSTSFDNPVERDAALKSEIKDRIYAMRKPRVMLSVMSRKNLSTFGNGTFDLGTLIEADKHEMNLFLKKWIFPDGPYFPFYYHLTTAIFIAQITLCICSGFLIIQKRQEASAPVMIGILGAFLYLCLWETNGRYFFQYEMLLLCLASLFPDSKKG